MDGEPNNIPQEENCVEIQRSPLVNNWNDINCSLEKEIICEKILDV